jgi:glucose/arabinose dehydrogenase
MANRTISMLAVALAIEMLTACGGGGVTGSTAAVSPAPVTSATPASVPPLANAQLTLPSGFAAHVIANVSGARELAALPNGDLLVGTLGSAVMIVPNAESAGLAGAATTFATLPDQEAAGVTYANGTVFVGTTFGVYRLAYTTGAQTATTPVKIASLRPGPFSTVHDRDHDTTDVAVAGSLLYAGVGSDCDACVELDPTRATVQQMNLDGSAMTTKATRWRNPIGLTVDPATNNVWVGGADQDAQPYGHPYEYMDAITTHGGLVDYGWPNCYENHTIAPGAPATSCSGVTIPALEFPAYSTIISSTFYPESTSGAYAFPAAYRGGLFVAMHGSWHVQPNSNLAASEAHVAFVPFANGMPATAVTWSDPMAQWQEFFAGFGTTTTRIGRPTGIAVGSQGSLFVADDQTGDIYRIRPTSATTQNIHRSETQ